MGPSNSVIEPESCTVYCVNEDGTIELLGTLDGIKSVESIDKEEPEDDKSKLIFSLLEPDEVTVTAKMTFWTRIKLWLWWKRLEIQKWLTLKKFERSFKKAAKEQKKIERRLHESESEVGNSRDAPGSTGGSGG